MHPRLNSNTGNRPVAAGRDKEASPVAKRVPASERTSEQIEDLLAAGVSGEKDVRSELIRLGMKKILEEALEAEVEARLGRGYYGREGEERGYRNGYRRSKLKSAEGAIEYAVPQVSDLGEAYRSRIREMIGGRSEMLEELATEMFARGLSTRN
ncbi:MAG TPA: hypothetical protein ENO14_00585, partial [Chromatiales bacterium]|nr:hypothetical protein [Chromatiales bacterium]